MAERLRFDMFNCYGRPNYGMNMNINLFLKRKGLTLRRKPLEDD